MEQCGRSDISALEQENKKLRRIIKLQQSVKDLPNGLVTQAVSRLARGEYSQCVVSYPGDAVTINFVIDPNKIRKSLLSRVIEWFRGVNPQEAVKAKIHSNVTGVI